MFSANLTCYCTTMSHLVTLIPDRLHYRRRPSSDRCSDDFCRSGPGVHHPKKKPAAPTRPDSATSCAAWDVDVNELDDDFSPRREGKGRENDDDSRAAEAKSKAATEGTTKPVIVQDTSILGRIGSVARCKYVRRPSRYRSAFELWRETYTKKFVLTRTVRLLFQRVSVGHLSQ